MMIRGWRRSSWAGTGGVASGGRRGWPRRREDGVVGMEYSGREERIGGVEGKRKESQKEWGSSMSGHDFKEYGKGMKKDEDEDAGTFICL